MEHSPSGEIVLVEGHPGEASVSTRFLREFGLGNPVRVLSDGIEALEYVFRTGRYEGHGTRPVLILLDLRTPLIGGLEVLRRIRGAATTRDIPVILTGRAASGADLVMAEGLGVAGFLVTPLGRAQAAQIARFAAGPPVPEPPPATPVGPGGPR